MNSSKPVAVVDLGSHSALLLIARHHHGDWQPLYEAFRITRLGEGLQQNGLLSEKSQQRALRTLREFKAVCQQWSCKQVYVLGTEALRLAQNSEQFAELLSRELDWQLNILSPEQEAVCGYLGAISVFPNFKEQAFTVVDVGGGSTEITLGKGVHIEKNASLPIGAARLARGMDFKVTLCSSDRMGLMQLIKTELENLPFWNEIKDSRVLVGSGGTITTLTAVHHKMEHYDAQLINRTTLDREQLWQLYYRINDLTLEERLKLPGIERGREDVLIYGTIIYLTLMELRKLELIRVSARGLRYGYLYFKQWETKGKL